MLNLSSEPIHPPPRIDQMRGQLMTVLPFITGPIIQRFPKRREPYRHNLLLPDRGEVPIYGDLYRAIGEQSSDRLRILLHGISSTNRSPYLAPHVREGVDSGEDVLTLALRGALGRGTDHYHAGLTEDLHEVVRDERLSHYSHISLIGFSMGGLTALNFHRECTDERLTATVALCPPLDLSAAQAHLDLPRQTVYRRLVLQDLKRTYRILWRRSQETPSPLTSDLEEVLKARTFDEWDRAVVLSRFKFDSVEEYREKASVHPESLRKTSTPALIVFDRADPMVPLHKLGLSKSSCSEQCTIRVCEGGGHISFPSRLDLGYGPQLGIAAQVGAWIDNQR